MKRTTLLSLNLFVFAAACGSSSPAEAPEEAAMVASQATSALAATSALSVDAAEVQRRDADLVAPDVDPCGMLRWENGALTIDYGSGCESRGVTFSGSYSISLSLSGGVSVMLAFDDLGIDDKVYRGDAAATIGVGRVDGNMDLTITEGSVESTVSFDGVLEGDEAEVSFDGRGSYEQGTVAASYDASGIRQKRGDCRPYAGSVLVSTPLVEEATVIFSESSPITGEVTVQIGAETHTFKLEPCAQL